MTTLALNYERELQGVKLFTVGTHTDSVGNKKDFTVEQLKGAVEAFNNSVMSAVPVKMGHSSPKFAKKVADALEIPEPLLLGEGITGKGAVRLGRLVKMLFDNDSLYGDFAIPDKVAELVKDGFLTDLSVELQFNRAHSPSKALYPIVMSGIAFLGAQRPALGKLLPGLNAATLYEDGRAYSAFTLPLVTSNAYYERGETNVDPNIASDGTPGADIFTVPFRSGDSVKGRQIFATVSAANEISAKSVAWRVMENFALNASGPAGTIIGTVLGGLAAKFLIMGRVRKGGSTIGRVKWSGEEQGLATTTLFDNSDYVEDDEMLKDILRFEVPDNVDPEAWSQ